MVSWTCLAPPLGDLSFKAIFSEELPEHTAGWMYQGQGFLPFLISCSRRGNNLHIPGQWFSPHIGSKARSCSSDAWYGHPPVFTVAGTVIPVVAIDQGLLRYLCFVFSLGQP